MSIMNQLGLGMAGIGTANICNRCLSYACQCVYYNQMQQLATTNLFTATSAMVLETNGTGISQVVSIEPSINQLLLLLE